MTQLIKLRTKLPLTLLRDLPPDHASRPMDIINIRIESCRKTRRSNCIGTALYIVGEIAKDEAVSIVDVYGLHLEQLCPIEYIFIGCLVAWQRDYSLDCISYGKNIYVEHMGIVTGLGRNGDDSSILITNRFKTGGSFNENQPLSELMKTYSNELVFYLPRIFNPSQIEQKYKLS